MTAQHPGRRARRGRARRVLLVVSVVTAGALVAASCSGDDTASTSTTTTTAPGPATTRPTLPPAGAGDDHPLSVAWVTQVGGAGTDSLAGAAGRNDAVVAVGSTTGMSAPARTGTDAVVLSVDAGNGTVRTTTQLGADGAVAATAVASAPTTGLTLACGTTTGSLAAAPAGGTDAWCGPITPAGAVEGPVQFGGDADDAIASVAVTDNGDHAYAAGRTDSLFPGARDTTGGYVGSGDALLLRLEPGARPQWARQFGSADVDEAGAVATSDDGDAVVGGTTAGPTGDSSAGGTDGWVARLDQDGMQRWLTQFGSTKDDRVDAVGVGGDPTRGTETFVAGGSTNGVVGGADSTPAGGTDALAVAIDSSGKQLWARQFGSAADDVVTGVVFDGSTVYVAGTAGGPIVGSERVPLVPAPAEGSSTTTAPPTTAPPGGTGRDGFLAALDAATGEVRWTSTFGSSGDDDVAGLTRTETGLLVVSGTTNGQVGATPPGGGTDGFLVAFRLPQSGGGAASAV